MYQPPVAAGFLVCRGSVAEDLVVANSVASLTATVTGVTLYRVNIAILDLLHNANMVYYTILAGVLIPIEKDNVAWAWLVGIVLPKATVGKPLDPVGTAGKLGYDPVVDITALVGAP